MAHYNYDMTVKLGMTGIPFEAQLFTDGVPFDLTGCNITFRMKLSGSGVYKVNAAAIADPDQTLAGRRGWFSYPWIPADLDTLGNFDAAVRVLTIGGKPIEWPAVDNPRFARIRVVPVL